MLKIETNEIVLRIIIFICQYLKIKEIKVSIWFNKTCTDYPIFFFLSGTISLCDISPFACYWSKDEILILHFF